MTLQQKTIIVFLIFFSCGCDNEDCPEEVILGPYLTYESVDKYIQIYDSLNYMEFINSDNNILQFSKTKTELKVRELRDYDTYYCDDNADIIQDRKTDLEISRFIYTTENGDTLKVRYTPSVHFMSPYISSYGQSFVITTDGAKIVEARTIWEEEEINESFKKYIFSYSVGDYIYSNNIYYWDSIDDTDLYFKDGMGLVGFIDRDSVKWIRRN